MTDSSPYPRPQLPRPGQSFETLTRKRARTKRTRQHARARARTPTHPPRPGALHHPLCALSCAPYPPSRAPLSSAILYIYIYI